MKNLIKTLFVVCCLVCCQWKQNRYKDLRHNLHEQWKGSSTSGSRFRRTTSYPKRKHSERCTLNSVTLFWLAGSVLWIFEISARDVITADYTIIMSSTLKVTGYHVMYDRSAWFLRVIMSSSRGLCCLPSVKKQKHEFYFFWFNV